MDQFNDKLELRRTSAVWTLVWRAGRRERGFLSEAFSSVEGTLLHTPDSVGPASVSTLKSANVIITADTQSCRRLSCHDGVNI
jgi:hypothetical protein